MKSLGFGFVAALLPLSHAYGEGAIDNVWRLYRTEEPFATLAVMDKAEVDAEEPYWALAFQCSVSEPWTVTVADVDARALGEAIADGSSVEFAFLIDGKAPENLGAFYPDLHFDQMFGEWQYSTGFDLSVLDILAAAKELAVTGAGVDLPLPSEGMAAALAEFRDICADFDQLREQGAPPAADQPSDEL